MVVGISEGTHTLVDGLNTFNFTIANPTPGTSTTISVFPTAGGPYSTSHTFDIRSVTITYLYTLSENRIDYVADYFPYGKILRKFVNGDEERYLTTQHERDEETGLDYRGARYYDSDIARFLSLDPHAVKYPEWSAYSYAFCNPIAFVDSDGKDPDPVAKVKSISYDANTGNYTIIESVRTVQTTATTADLGTHTMVKTTTISERTTFTSVLTSDGEILSSESSSMSKTVVSTKYLPKTTGELTSDPTQTSYSRSTGTDAGPLAASNEAFAKETGGMWVFPLKSDYDRTIEKIKSDWDGADLQSPWGDAGLEQLHATEAKQFKDLENKVVKGSDFVLPRAYHHYKEQLKKYEK